METTIQRAARVSNHFKNKMDEISTIDLAIGAALLETIDSGKMLFLNEILKHVAMERKCSPPISLYRKYFEDIEKLVQKHIEALP